MVWSDCVRVVCAQRDDVAGDLNETSPEGLVVPARGEVAVEIDGPAVVIDDVRRREVGVTAEPHVVPGSGAV